MKVLRPDRALFAVTAALALAYFPMYLYVGSAHARVYGFPGAITLTATTSAALGLLITSRAGGNRIGWLFLLLGLDFSCVSTGELYAIAGQISHPGALPLAGLASWITSWLYL